ncbi:MAG: hypothetical protein B7Y36_04700 [Novosphingobium sp. 28-62-57]|uniref:DUF4136 domain-containing protein n=1 Tax=Novosphingobium sp. 28-62-57 TaxID=1970409 RepID=UPI000BC39E8B|nr:DUF4136 domain-containing protein [Novosphingobium sp. 28-62-57]OYZ11466.1 MAG: hypothetical protein B7Y36_04700 [Novosphingobium sp. 28-62-57]
MKRLAAALALSAVTITPALAKPAPVEVTRFHTPETLARLKGVAAMVEAAPGSDPKSLEDKTWLAAVQRELAAQGYGPVSVGVGGSTGSFGSGLGLGLGFNLGGGPKDFVVTRLSVRIRDKRTGESLWEGRADNRESAKAKEAAIGEAAPRLARALFSGFPGTSGETISVK